MVTFKKITEAVSHKEYRAFSTISPLGDNNSPAGTRLTLGALDLSTLDLAFGLESKRRDPPLLC